MSAETAVATPPIVDLHCHFPMHVNMALHGGALRAMTRKRGRWPKDAIRAFILDIANRLFNYKSPEAGPAVSVSSLVEGQVAVALSVLYQPFDEIEGRRPFGGPPRDDYFDDLVAQLERVERAVHNDSGRAVVARDPDELRAAMRERKLALVHAVEGGFHVGSTPQRIRERVAFLAGRGVAYITIAHLFWRGVATNVPALPFLPDWLYRMLFPQPANVGLSDLGRALVDAMVEQRMLIDLTHMSERGIRETLARVPKDVPVLATHVACRLKGTAYNLGSDTIAAIAEHQGVMGVIFCEHYANEGAPRTETFRESFEVIARQINQIHSITGTHDHTAIGTDLDGFIKPTLWGFESPRAFPRLASALADRYGAPVAEKICSANALRLLLDYWRRPD